MCRRELCSAALGAGADRGFDTSISFYGEDTDIARRMNQWAT